MDQLPEPPEISSSFIPDHIYKMSTCTWLTSTIKMVYSENQRLSAVSDKANKKHPVAFAGMRVQCTWTDSRNVANGKGTE